jgi:hypothetical protein
MAFPTHPGLAAELLFHADAAFIVLAALVLGEAVRLIVR